MAVRRSGNQKHYQANRESPIFSELHGLVVKTTTAAYGRYDGMSDRIAERLSALTPPNADPQAVADEIARIVGLPAGTRPFRSVIDFVGDGAEEVTAVAEKVRIEFAHRIGIADLLTPAVRPALPS